MTATRPALVVVLVSTLGLAACGQKPGVYVDPGPVAVTVGDDDTAAPVTPHDDDHGAASHDRDLEVPTDDIVAGSTAPAGDPPAAGPARQPRRGPATVDPSGASQPSQRQPRGEDRTGVTDDVIAVAIHAPVTGAAPVPAGVFQTSGDLYWRWILDVKGEQVLGRDEIDFRFADDRFEPSTARQVCRELAADAFLLLGGAGADGISACGQLAGQIQVPYFSAGVTEVGLRDNPWYFAMSMSYVQQADLLAQMVQARFPGKRSAAVVFGSRSADDGLAAWEQAVARRGLDYHRSLRTPPGQSNWYSSFARELADAGVEVVNIAVPPLDYIRFAQVVREQGHDFEFVGVGPTMGINGVLNSGCPAVANGTFLSPIPSLDLVDDLASEFRQAAEHFDVPVEDTALALWAVNASLHQLFDQYEEVFGADLTREDFRDLVSHQGRVETGIFPPVRIQTDDHFGGRSMHVLVADCDRQIYADGGTFVDSF